MSTCVCIYGCGLPGGVASLYIQVNQGTVRRTGSDRVIEVTQRTVKKGGNLSLEVGEEVQRGQSDSQRRDSNWPVVNWKGPTSQKTKVLIQL